MGGTQSDRRLSELDLVNARILPYLKDLGYTFIEGNVNVNLGNRTLEADCVVYLDKDKQNPYIVVEAKQALRAQATLLEPAVQHAFAVATALGDQVRFLLITDGEEFRWFERNAETQSLVLSKYPPVPPAEEINNEPSVSTLFVPISSRDQYLALLQSVIDVLRKEELVFGLRMGIEVNRILIAKLHDEKMVLSGLEPRFHARDGDANLTGLRVRTLYEEAIATFDCVSSGAKSWTLSSQTLETIVRMLEPYGLSSINPSIRGRSFWKLFTPLLRKGEGQHTTPPPLAELLVQLARPKRAERIIDPACGTGLLLLEAFEFVRSHSNRPVDSVLDFKGVSIDLVGIEVNSEVAELAATNFVLNNLSPDHIRTANSLIEIPRTEDEWGRYDLVLLNPPLGSVPQNIHLLHNSELRHIGSQVTLEALFIELALRLLRDGGRLATLVPDTLLSAPRWKQFRRWLLENVTPKAIISLPPQTFAPVGHSGKASLLLLEKTQGYASRSEILVADVQSVGYDSFGQPVAQNDIPRVVECVERFFKNADMSSGTPFDRPRVWQVRLNTLTAARFDITSLDPEGQEVTRVLSHGKYPIAKLKDVAEIISGRNFKNYVARELGTAVVIQANAVREFDLEAGRHSPNISAADYETAKRAQISVGDVLVTSTGQYLGRTATVESLVQPAVASGAVTILRPKMDIEPQFLAALLNSSIGRNQIKRLQASATAQPYIRRSDLGEILVPLPPKQEQSEMAAIVTQKHLEARELRSKAEKLEQSLNEVIETAFLEESDDE